MTLGEEYQAPVPGRLHTIVPQTQERARMRHTVIDAHVHIMDRRLYPWFAPGKAPTFEGPWDPLFGHDFTADDLRAESAGSRFELAGCVHIQANAADPVDEVATVQRMGERAGLPIAIVAGGDLSAPDVEATLEAEASYPATRGFRQNLNIHPHPLYAYVDRSYMDDPQWLAGLALLPKYRMSFDMQLYPTQFARACEVIDANPETMFIINHTGMWADRDLDGWRLWRDGLCDIARRDNTAIKLSGMPSLDHYWTIESIRPLVYTCFDAFGPDRCLFASNFPVDKLHTSYIDLLTAFERCTEELSADEQAAFFAGNARRIYRC